MRLRLPRYVHGFKDRHGKARYYYRRNGKRMPLPGLPHSTEFMDALDAATKGEPLRLNVGADRTLPGSINALTVAYFNSAEFANLAPITKKTYRGVIERFRSEHGDRGVAAMDRRAVKALIDQRLRTPAAAASLLKRLRMLMLFAIDNGWRKDDPTFGIKAPKQRRGGWHTWTEDEIQAFREHHALGTRARLALELLLNLGQRRGDIVRIGRQHVRQGVLSIAQQKTGQDVDIPVLTEAQEAIRAHPSDNMTFLVTSFGKPFSAAGFGNWFREVCDEAGLPQCSAHGLRKACARRLAECGATASQIASVTGHRTLQEVTRYTEAADRKKLAADAVSALNTKRTSSGKPS